MTARAAPPAAQPAVTVFARGPFQAGGVVILDEDEANHLKVRRVADGDAVRLVDGRGGIATARVARDKDLVAVRVVATTMVPAPPLTEAWVGAGDRDRFLGASGVRIDDMQTSYFLSRDIVIPTFGAGMAMWREKLFANMHRNAAAAADFLNLPTNRIVELGSKMEI